jgi:cytochrome c oxidase subunit 1
MSDLSKKQGQTFRLPMLWATTAVLVFLLSRRPLSDVRDNSDAFRSAYVVAHHHYMISIAAIFVLFGAIYLFLEILPGVRYRQKLGYAHLGLAFIGALLLLAPGIILNLTPMSRRYADPAASFAFWNTVSVTGYVMTLVGLFLFILLVVDSTRLTLTKASLGKDSRRKSDR